MSDFTFEISIPCDDEGFLTLSCPACSEQFKLLADDYDNDNVIDIFCPYCGLSNSTSDFLTEDVIEAATREAENHAMKMIDKSLGKMVKDLNKSGFIEAKIKGDFKESAPKDLLEENNMKIIKFECCAKEIKITDNMPNSLFYCCFCGVDNE